MANIALQDGKVVLKDGKASCSCCGGCNSLPDVCFSGVIASRWVGGDGFCSIDSLGPNEIGAWSLFVYFEAQVTEFIGFGLEVCCNASCFGVKDDWSHPVYGTYTINTATCGQVQVTIYPPPC